MQNKTSISVRIEPELQILLDDIAIKMDRSRSWLINNAIRNFTSHYKWQQKKIERGLYEARNGLFASPEEVERVLNKY